jgi:hypothetical protein
MSNLSYSMSKGKRKPGAGKKCIEHFKKAVEIHAKVVNNAIKSLHPYSGKTELGEAE